MKILILTDSLGLPRAKPEYCSYGAIWPQLLTKDHNVHQLSIGGGTIIEIYAQLQYHKHFNPDLVVLQSGIVDCAPRALSKWEITTLKKIRYFGPRILKLVKRWSVFFRKYRNLRYTKPEEFQHILTRISTRTFSDIPVLALSIVNASDAYEKKLPGIQKSVRLYNSILTKVFRESLISLEDMPLDGVMSDGHHLNETGHQFVYDCLLERICTL